MREKIMLHLICSKQRQHLQHIQDRRDGAASSRGPGRETPSPGAQGKHTSLSHIITCTMSPKWYRRSCWTTAFICHIRCRRRCSVGRVLRLHLGCNCWQYLHMGFRSSQLQILVKYLLCARLDTTTGILSWFKVTFIVISSYTKRWDVSQRTTRKQIGKHLVLCKLRRRQQTMQ